MTKHFTDLCAWQDAFSLLLLAVGWLQKLFTCFCIVVDETKSGIKR